MPTTAPAKSPASDSASFQGTDAVNTALQLAPEVRPEAVARARMLIADAQYPPASTINAISKLLVAANLNQDESQI
jgi:hypothetical protein